MSDLNSHSRRGGKNTVIEDLRAEYGEPSEAQVARYLHDHGHYVPEDLRSHLGFQDMHSEQPSSENAYTGIPFSEVIRSEQSEPSDAQIEAAWRTYEDVPPETFVMGPSIGKARERMRAALLAAAEVDRSLAAFRQISNAQERLSAAVNESRWPCGCRYSFYELSHPDEGHVDGDHRPVGA